MKLLLKALKYLLLPTLNLGRVMPALKEKGI